MATSSFTTKIQIRSRREYKKFVKALENSKAAPKKKVQMSKTIHEMTPEQIRKVFGGDND